MPTPSPNPAGSELYVWHSLTGARETALRSIFESFAAQNQDRIRVRLEYHVDLQPEVLTAASAGTPPDLVVTSCDDLALFASRGLAVSLATYQNDPTFGLSDAQRADLWPVVLQGCLDTSSDQPLGLLFDIQAQLLYYNSAWLKRLKTDAPPVSWDQFRTLSNAARDRKSGTWGLAFDGSSLSVSNWIASLGGSLLDESGQLSLASPAATEALTTLNDLRQDGCVTCSLESGAARGELAAEKALFTIDSTAQLHSYQSAIQNPKTQKARFTWDLAPLPSGSGEPTVLVEGLTIGILRTSPGQQMAAWLLIKWLAEPSNHAPWILATGSLPMHRSTLDSPEMKSYIEALPQYRTAALLMAYAQTEPAGSVMPMIRGLLSTAARAVCQGAAGPEEALLAADTAAEIILAR